MSGEWWADTDAAGDTDSPSEESPPHPLTHHPLRGYPPPHPPPAVLLRLPPSFRPEQPRRQALDDLSRPDRLECRDTGFSVGTPVSQYGTFKLWKARSVDLRSLLFAFLRPGLRFTPPDPEDEEAGQARRQLPVETGERSPLDELAQRLAVVLQPPPELLLGAAGPLQWPASLFPFQRDGIQALVQSKHLLLGDDMGLGKAQPLDARVLTPTGWRLMGQIRVGDLVIGADGLPAQVVGVFPQGNIEIYRVTFSDGSVTECSDDHLWCVRTPQWKWRRAGPRILSLRQIRNRLRDGAGNAFYFVPLVKPVRFAERDSPLPLDPYLLGLLLGDGGLAHRVHFSTRDAELLDRVRASLLDGTRLVHCGRCDYRISGAGAGRPNPVMAALRSLGVMGHKAASKFIPQMYLFGSVGERVALLQGLLDTDGYANRDGTLQFYSVSTQLAQGVRALVQSLGGTARLSLKKTTGQPCYVVGIALPPGTQPFRLARKLAAFRPRTKYLPSRAIVAVDPIGSKPAQCIAVDSPDQLYVTDDFVVTHNTVQAIAALRVLMFRREIERALVVVPASLLEQWRRELLLWAPELRVMLVHGSPESRSWRWQYRAHVTLTSYETLRVDYTGTANCGPCRQPWNVVVLDEAQRIKNRESDVARACKGLPRARSWALTGTPLENSAEDVLSILEFVTGDDLKPPALAAGFSLRAALGQFQLRRRKADVLLDLPPKIVTELVLPLTRAQRQAYDRAEREGLVALRERGDARIENVIALITRLKQICNFAPSGEASAKMDDLEARLEELTAAGHKALIFTQYTSRDSGARRIAHRLQRFSPLLYTGDMDVSARSRAVERFQEEEGCPILILSLKAGGQGLNLQRASYVFHFDRWWNPAVERQAEDRSHRLGQTQPVSIYRYVMANTIEERLDELLKRKTLLFERLVDEASLDLSRLIDQRDLFGLVGLPPPERASADPTGSALEARVAHLLERQGYRVERTGGKQDGGVDLIAEKRDALGTRIRVFVQCKDTERPAGVEVVRSLNGVLPPGDRGVTGVVVGPAGFTPEAHAFAAARQIQLWDRAQLARLEAG